MIASTSAPAIVGWGAVSSLGANALHTALFLRAGQHRFHLSPFVDTWGERIAMAYLPTVSAEVRGPERMALLARLAFAEAVAPISLTSRIGITVSLPERYADAQKSGSLTNDGKDLVARIESDISQRAKDFELKAVPEGRAGGANALNIAATWLAEGRIETAVVGGVESYFEWEPLQELRRRNRIVDADNVDGVVPGEGAAFVVLSANARKRKPPSIARLVGIGLGNDPHKSDSEEVCRAEGLTSALRDAVAPLRASQRRTNYWLADLTNESNRVREFQIIVARFGDVLGTDTQLVTALRQLGDVGAAALPMFWVLCAEAWQKGYGLDSVAISFAGSESGARGAAVWEALECP